ncbi:endonuclease [Microbacterium phage Eleri]|uniref:Nuclease n=7 Tax=Elerivirus eleri TaxID=2560589 RepID=A0A6N0A4F8_9CAUD|nr:endonuclease [Microbacterium phage Eleri]AXH48605.1 nuclease [Microbacterium phage Sansa]AXH70586.1 nuclease [Microbacterium phage ColaCorta]AXH70711.1 nuclease [Microbacterium phage Andromedas]QDF15762.1 nuclease [Microbacterium phage Finny]QDK03693.1 nuclease [Microbacterium phage MCubed]QKO02661.1 nuclease [Microbacterium phage Glamour]UDG78991.1 nuclease [Microbacterium phage Saratos]WNN93834.1 VRR-Nuc domain protein [Microbacterium phage Zenitsu]WNN95827.1 VRR-Nuc domain protein [M
MDEAEIVRKMMARLNALPGVYCLRTHGGSFQQKGTPDIVGCAHGHFFAIEAKRTAREQPSVAQRYNLKKFRQAGGVTFVSHDPKVQEVVEWISSL